MSGGIALTEVKGTRTRTARQFIRLPLDLYRDEPRWVPWFSIDMRSILSKKHPFFEHSDAAFYVASRDGRPAGRIAVLQNTHYNETHGTNAATFYFFDAIDDAEVARELLDAASEWARGRNLDAVFGPMLFGGATGGGILVDGYENRAAMTMMNYNYPYYQRLLEEAGFSKYLDLYSASLRADTFTMPEKITHAAEVTIKRGNFTVQRFRRKSELKALAGEIGELYNTVLGTYGEDYPLTENEIKAVTKDLLLVARPELIKLLRYRGEIAGFVFAFPDLSRAMQMGRGRLTPLNLLRLLREFGRTRELIFNGAGILPQYQRLGGNALLYKELELTCKERGGWYVHADITQVSEKTVLMLSDIQKLGAKIYKTHRIYRRAV